MAIWGRLHGSHATSKSFQNAIIKSASLPMKTRLPSERGISYSPFQIARCIIIIPCRIPNKTIISIFYGMNKQPTHRFDNVWQIFEICCLGRFRLVRPAVLLWQTYLWQNRIVPVSTGTKFRLQHLAGPRARFIVRNFRTGLFTLYQRHRNGARSKFSPASTS